MIETAVVPASLDRYPGLAAQPAVTQLLTFQYFPAGASRIDMLDSLTVFLTDRCSQRNMYKFMVGGLLCAITGAILILPVAFSRIRKYCTPHACIQHSLEPPLR